VYCFATPVMYIRWQHEKTAGMLCTLYGIEGLMINNIFLNLCLERYSLCVKLHHSSVGGVCTQADVNNP
jgi:hypothetical protein